MVQPTGSSAWLVCPPKGAEDEAPGPGAGLRAATAPLADECSDPQGQAALRLLAEPAQLQQLLDEHQDILADVAELRANFNDLLKCVQEHGIVVPRHKGGAPSLVGMETALALPQLPTRIFTYAGQVAWSAAMQVSRSTRSSARAVQEERLFITGGVHGHFGSETRTSESLDLESGKWQPEVSLPFARVGHVGGVIRNYFYVCGGQGPTSRSVACFNPAQPRWRILASLNKPRGFAAAAVVGDGLYVIGGGSQDDQVWDSVECLYPKGASRASAWAILPGRTRQRRRFLAAVALEGNLLLCGGSSKPLSPSSFGDKAASTAEVFSLAAGSSHAISSMTVARIYHAAVVMKGKVLVLGGAAPGSDTILNSVESYDPATGSWALCTKWAMPRGCGGHQAMAIDGRVFVLGGQTAGKSGKISSIAESSVRRLDLDRGVWEELEPLKECRSSFLAGVVTCGTSLAV